MDNKVRMGGEELHNKALRLPLQSVYSTQEFCAAFSASMSRRKAAIPKKMPKIAKISGLKAFKLD